MTAITPPNITRAANAAGTAPLEDTAKAAEVVAANSGNIQPFRFVNGLPPNSASATQAINTAGMPAPNLNATVWAAQNAATQGDFMAIVNAPADLNATAKYMALMEKFTLVSLELRKNSLENRDKELANNVALKELGIGKFLESAKTQLMSGILQSALQGIGGVMTIKAGKAGEQVGAGKFQGMSAMANSMGGIASSSMNFWAANQTAEQQRYELKAETATARMQQENERASNFLTMFTGFRDAELNMQQSLGQASNKIWS